MKKILVVGKRANDGNVADLEIPWGQELYHLCYVSDGLEALRVGRELKPDLFLINYELMSMNGIDVFDSLHNEPELAKVPAILSCVGGDEEALRYAVAARKLYVLWQQIDLLSLLRLIEMALSTRGAKRQMVLQGQRAS
ncbi:hypothetical protein [Ktedonospora formicarum]|uniref:Response regulatory domain-containing protein n=1 Tax=Ktedonospora formicarum TaxID=2778364 RepID=A0A8J3HYP6_9CHLR|nr:hypothetical protein [Ktedonospora formicarum]GHO46652.1 hypothetical protein KSX_48150 [Ktedonospora formicarum]